jgi:hypothetical protein
MKFIFIKDEKYFYLIIGFDARNLKKRTTIIKMINKA